MRELSVSEVKEVNGGAFVAAYWLVKGGIAAYRTYKGVRWASNAMAGGAFYDGVKSLVQ